MSAKIQIKNDIVRNFDGFFSFVDHFRKDRMSDIVDNALGYRSVFAKYSNSDIFLSQAAIFLTGGTCIEDANRLSHNFTEISQGYRFCSADTILRMIKAAKEFPDVEFCHATGYQAALCGLPNVHNYFVSAFEDGTPVILYGVNTYSVMRSHPDFDAAHEIFNIYYNQATDDPNVFISDPKQATCYGHYGEFVLICYNGSFGWIKDTGLSVYGNNARIQYTLYRAE